MPNRIRFTDRELDLILSMANVADASVPGEGDYQEWTDADYVSLNTLANKVVALLQRRSNLKRKPKNASTRNKSDQR